MDLWYREDQIHYIHILVFVQSPRTSVNVMPDLVKWDPQDGR